MCDFGCNVGRRRLCTTITLSLAVDLLLAARILLCIVAALTAGPTWHEGSLMQQKKAPVRRGQSWRGRYQRLQKHRSMLPVGDLGGQGYRASQRVICKDKVARQNANPVGLSKVQGSVDHCSQ